MGYAHYFMLTFFLSFPAYLLLPWAKRMLEYSASLPATPSPDAERVEGAKGAAAG
jgi:PAT family beta-lactamase induction signal transducer AmpG